MDRTGPEATRAEALLSADNGMSVELRNSERMVSDRLLIGPTPS